MASFSFGNAAPAQGGGGNFSFNAPVQQQAPQQQQQQGGGGNKFKLILVGKLTSLHFIILCFLSVFKRRSLSF